MRRLLTILTVSTLLLVLIAPLPVRVSGAAQGADPASAGDVSYTSPAFGYNLSWSTDSWVLEELSHWSDGWNMLQLALADVEDSSVRVVGETGFDGDPEACVDDLDAFLRSDEDISDLEVTDAPADLPETGIIDDAVALYTYTRTYTFSEPADNAHLIACEALPSGDAVLWLDVTVPRASYETIVSPVESLAAGITLGNEADRSGALQGLYDVTYTNPRWGFTVPLDQPGWTLQVIDHSLNYTQSIELEREASYAWIEAEGYDYETEEELSPRTCLSDALEEINDFDDVGDVEVINQPDDYVASFPADAMSALVSYTLPDGDGRVGFTDLIACSSMDGGRAVLSIWVSSYTDAYDSEGPAIQQLVSGISTPADDEPGS